MITKCPERGYFPSSDPSFFSVETINEQDMKFGSDRCCWYPFLFFYLCLCARARRVPTGSLRLIPLMSTEGLCGPTEDTFNPNPNHNPTMLISKAISGPNKPRMYVDVIVEEVWTSTFLTMISSFPSFLLKTKAIFEKGGL